MALNFVSGRTGAFDWLFQRISGVVLALILGLHFIILHLISGGEYEYEVIMTRLANPSWKVFYFCFLFFALYHAMNGAKILIDDYIHHPRLRTLLLSLDWLLAIVLFLYGTLIILMHQAPAVKG
ncbi:MAG: succinate dehydrogenase, hydrophobic membrane anchor protein [Deltaproteobacteria bacterium]|nr:succinate dehydrogenase, hydrophobic membrane anchor protein [Deltaproteobacteria bacterium]MBW2051766.1 succinate dehydrogenase, hydrophobic membrane anchor protein [Deltaproteobacteria bacterium]MBW2140379.1 succinate dehydrogenase, hydrophobic membrane anchor protein [Deltaproteobacteria bacterium]MBW2322364.1 succinate dehydrogenase, hydrophobic membrane anchor protein [Deltaproteobacteria bacterium]